jgi:hypothetical protein
LSFQENYLHPRAKVVEVVVGQQIPYKFAGEELIIVASLLPYDIFVTLFMAKEGWYSRATIPPSFVESSEVSLEIIFKLVEFRGSTLTPNVKLSIFRRAVSNTDVSLMKALTGRGLQIPSQEYEKALMLSATTNSLELLRYLLEMNSYSLTKGGMESLATIAVTSNKVDILKLFADTKRFDFSFNDGYLFEYAQLCNFSEVLALLESVRRCKKLTY